MLKISIEWNIDSYNLYIFLKYSTSISISYQNIFLQKDVIVKMSMAKHDSIIELYKAQQNLL